MPQTTLPIPATIYQGSLVETLLSWPDACFDHCIADPPFNMSKPKGLTWAFSSHVTMQESWDRFTPQDYLDFSRAWLTQVTRVVKPNGNLFIFGTYHNIYQLGALVQSMELRILNSIIWSKSNAQPNITTRMLTESTEQIIWVVNGSPQRARNWTFNYQTAKSLNGGKQMRNVWEISVTPRSERTLGRHPSQKPLKLLDRLIQIGTNPNDLILDAFSGAGTTTVVAQRLGRRWVAVEQQPDYVQILVERLKGDGAPYRIESRMV